MMPSIFLRAPSRKPKAPSVATLAEQDVAPKASASAQAALPSANLALPTPR
ncbi:hypothetical protein KGO95_03625 [Patescibacteria group bacterium]|nr:hypothetical protein [Patescibacteria group bacterium]